MLCTAYGSWQNSMRRALSFFWLMNFATANTVDPDQPAAVGVSYGGTNVCFTFDIPQGNNGSDGAQGPPGEVSQAQLDNAIASISANTNSVDTLDTPFADPDMEALRQKLNEMILNGRR